MRVSKPWREHLKMGIENVRKAYPYAVDREEKVA
jgi:hypothetical protein